MDADHCPVCGTPWPHPDPSKLVECLEEWYKHPKEEKDAYERMIHESRKRRHPEEVQADDIAWRMMT